MSQPPSPFGHPASWDKEFPGAITVCDTQGKIIFMNDRALRMFAKDGGGELLGQNLLDCHPEPSRTKLRHLLESGEANTYTIEKKGIKKLIHQSPWYQDGAYAGLVELGLEIPLELPHFLRG